ncbi:MAG: CoA transferase [Quisquiliibacterium sp.]
MRNPSEVLAALWGLADLPSDALTSAHLTGADPALPSSFAVGTAAQTTIAAAALAASEIRYARTGRRQQVAVDMRHAALDCCGHFSIDDRVPAIWDRFSGLYPCGGDTDPGWIRIHANFAHHRDGALALLGLKADEATTKDDVIKALASWGAANFEQAAADAGLVVTAMRSFEQWDAHPQAAAIAALPLLTIEKIGEAPARPLPPATTEAAPLSGLRVLDLTRILAGPTCGRMLAACGADVMLINSPHLPNIEAIIDTSRGKLSTLLDLRERAGAGLFTQLLSDAHVMVQGYRPGGLEQLGFGPQQAAAIRPGIVYVTLSAYGHQGPWAARRGFDSLVQTATGFNRAEGQAAGTDQPKPLPMQILDYASGYLMAFAAQAALLRQSREGGSWHVRVSLAQTGHWLRSLGRVQNGLAGPAANFDGYQETTETGWGRLVATRPAPQFAHTSVGNLRPSMPPGSHPPRWPG